MRIKGTMRSGLNRTATAVAAMAALTASQAPGFTGQPLNAEKAAAQDGVVWTQVPNDDSYHTELPPLKTPEPPEAGPKPPGPVDILATRAEAGIPATVLAAYRRAEAALGRSDPGCNLPWQLLAAIGKVESGQARGGRVDAGGTTLGSILGPVLNGMGFAHISDTDGGAYDGDAQYDRAVGPMQFIPSTWAHWGKDGNGDGRRDPDNIYDASLAAGHYLCAGSRNLNTRADLDRAILSHNHSDTYLRTVLSWLEFYRQGVHPVADGEGPVPRSPGPGGPTGPKAPVGGPGAQGSPGGPGSGSPGKGGGGIVIGPQPTTPPPLPTPPAPSRPPSPSPDPTETGPTDPGPDPTDTGSPSPSPSPTDPTTPPVTPPPTTPPTTLPPPPSPDPDPTTTAPACPTDSPSPDPSDTTAPGTGTPTGDPDPCAGTAASAA